MTLSTRQIRTIAAFAGVNVLLVVVGWFALISPQQSSGATFNAQTQLAQTQLAQLMSSGTKDSTKQPAINTSCLYKLDTALPSQADQPELLFELQRVAEASGVKVIGVSPQPAQAVAAGYTMVPINLQVTGGYFALTAFLHNLRVLVAEHHGCPTAKGPLFAASSVAFSPQGNDGGNAPATVQIEAFYYGVTAGATPPASTTATDTTTTSGS